MIHLVFSLLIINANANRAIESAKCPSRTLNRLRKRRYTAVFYFQARKLKKDRIIATATLCEINMNFKIVAAQKNGELWWIV